MIGMHRKYSQLLKTNLIRSAPREMGLDSKTSADVLSFLHDEKTLHQLRGLSMDAKTSARKLAATAHLAYQRSKSLEKVRVLIQRVIDEEALNQKINLSGSESVNHDEDIRFLENLMLLEAESEIKQHGNIEEYLKKYPSEILKKLEVILRDAAKSLEVQKRAVSLLRMFPRQETADLLMCSSDSVKSHALRFVMIQALNHIHLQEPKIKIDVAWMRRQVGIEADLLREFAKTRLFFDIPESCPLEESNELCVILEAVREESLERLFGCLSLVYPPDMIQLIFSRIQQGDASDKLRSHAVELLNHILKKNVRSLLHHVFDHDEQRVDEHEMSEIIHKFRASRDRWLMFLAQTIVEEKKFAAVGAFPEPLESEDWLNLVREGNA